jgi:hypothetical protein
MVSSPLLGGILWDLSGNLVPLHSRRRLAERPRSWVSGRLALNGCGTYYMTSEVHEDN